MSRVKTKQTIPPTTSVPVLGVLFIGILLTIFAGIVLHAPFSVYMGSLLPESSLVIKSWKEILLGVAGLLLVVLLFQRKAWHIFNTRLFYAVIGFAAVVLVMVPVFFLGIEATLAGVLINLRFLLFFALVYAAVRLYPPTYTLFVRAFFAGAGLVMAFAVLQLTVLPHDVLKHLGYGPGSIAPFMTVDENPDYVRINSTLRGPNPLGAYAVIVLAAVASAAAVLRTRLSKKQGWLLGVLGVASLVALFASYSRAAALGAFAALGLVALLVYGRKIPKYIWAAAVLSLGLLVTGVYVFKDTQFVSQVILHEDPHEGNDFNSNDEHAESFAYGLDRMLHQPFGAGIGSTGSASMQTDAPLIIENQLLFTAHETGWLGLLLFMYVQASLLVLLWERKKQWLALAVFTSGIGLIIVGMVLPAWADDTVSLIWWGLAGVALAAPGVSPEHAVQAKRKKSTIKHT